MTERWRPIAGFEGRYEVSDLGRVRSLSRIILYTRICYGKVQHRRAALAGQQLVATADLDGYLGVWLGRSIRRPIHRLVLETFVGPPPSEVHEGCHNDGTRNNNALGNLRWDTPAGNQADRQAHGTALRGEQISRAKLTADAVLRIRSDDRTEHEIAKEYGVRQTTINRVKSRHTWRHV